MSVQVHQGRSFLFSSRRRHTRFDCDWSSDVCSSDLGGSDLYVAQRRDKDDDFGWGRPPRIVARGTMGHPDVDRKSVVEGKSVDLGGRRIIKKKKQCVHSTNQFLVTDDNGFLTVLEAV